MGKYVIKRCVSMIFIIIAAAFVIFTITYLAPGDPASAILGATASESDLEKTRHALGVDLPYLQQLWNYMKSVFINFDLGDSWVYGKPVLEELGLRMPRTLLIGLTSMVFNVALGVCLGIFAGTHGGKWQDSLTMGIAMIFISCPDFFVALEMIILFAAHLRILPPFGIGSWKHYVMPIVASALQGIATNARYGRNSILEVYRADFVTTARAKGVPEHDVVYKHMLPNALMPIITNMGMILSHIITGSVVIESVFSIPGVGLYMLDAVTRRDYPVIRGCVLFFAVAISVIMLLTDLAYAMVDPRIKVQYSAQGARKRRKSA